MAEQNNGVVSEEQFSKMLDGLFSENRGEPNPEPNPQPNPQSSPESAKQEKTDNLPEFNYEEFLAGQGNPFSTEEEPDPEPEDNPAPEGTDDPEATDGLIAFEIEGQEVTYNINKPEEFDRLVTDAKSWKENEKTVTELISQKDELKTSRDSFLNAIKLLHGQRNFDLMNNPEDFLEEQSFDYYLDLADQDKNKAREFQKKHREELIRAEEFQKNFAKSQKKFLEIQSEFKKSHPEITDTDKWIKENLTPYSSFVATYGEAEPPPDILEMIYFWKNKDSFIKELKSRVAKEIATRKVTPPTSGGKPAIASSPYNRKTKSEGEAWVDDVFSKMMKKFEGEKVLTRFKG